MDQIPKIWLELILFITVHKSELLILLSILSKYRTLEFPTFLTKVKKKKK